MAKCDLSIELDRPKLVHSGGDKVSGTLHVQVDADVKCSGLEVSSGWQTHGRGNVARGTAETVTLFTGQWTAGQRKSYRFELEVAPWPPSYHGNFINVDHYVQARAKIPWAFDPKASAEFLMRPSSPPDAVAAGAVTAASGCIATGVMIVILGMVLLGVAMVAVGMATNPIIAVIGGVVILPIAGVVLAKTVLPKWLLGNVEAELLTAQMTPGGRIRARMAFQPRRRVNIQSITAELTGAEVAISGSGSNRTTHRNVFFTKHQELEGAVTLQAGDRREFHFDFPLPDDVPYSFDLDDNDLNWTIELRVDIPRWPDWTRSLKLQVVPGGEPSARASADAEAGFDRDHGDLDLDGDLDGSDGEITFDETASLLWQSADDNDKVDLLVDAVLGMTFDLSATVERRLLYSGNEDPHVYQGGYAVWARHSESPLPLVLYVPHELADEFEQIGDNVWHFRGTVVGWDHTHRRLQIKVLVG